MLAERKLYSENKVEFKNLRFTGLVLGPELIALTFLSGLQ